MPRPVPHIQGATVMHGNARFTIISPVCVRMEYNDQSQFIDAPSLFAANREVGCEGFSAKANDENSALTIDTGAMRIVYNPSGIPLCSENLNVFFELDGEPTFWDPKARNLQNLGGTIPSLDGQRGPTPLGDGLLSRDGWHMIDDSNTHLMVDDWVQPRPTNSGQDWYLFVYGRDFQAALDSLTAVGGRIPLPRKYVLGSWYSRWHAYTSQEYRELVDEYDQHAYPLDILVWDMDWHRMDARSGQGWAKMLGWTGFSWNRKLLPDAEDLIAELKRRGIAVTVNVHPHDGVREHEDMYEDFMQELGKDPDKDAPPPFDAGNKDYVDAYFRHAHEPHENAGVAFWWVDWQQDVIMPEVPGVPGLKHLPWLNELYFRHSQRDNQRGLGFSRFAGWGDHRHPIHFSGDAVTGWEMLAFQVPFTTTSANVGCFFWSHDMGGFMGEIDDEIYARWLQFGAFTAAMRLHGLGSDRRPWKWADWAEPSMRRSFRLRSRLMPYTYSAVVRCCRESIPFCRAMYHENPEQETSYRNPQQYFYGDHFLVAPITSPGKGPQYLARQVVDFPEGSWYNWFTGERFEGRQERLIAADIHEMPLYVRGGIPIPMQPFRLRMTSAPLDELVIRSFPGPDGQTGAFTLYEDDGISQDYENGAFTETDITYRRNDDRITLRIEPARGQYEGMVEERAVRMELPCTTPAKTVQINGESAQAEYDEQACSNIVHIPSRSVWEAVEVTLNAADADQHTLRTKATEHRIKSLLGDSAGTHSIHALLNATAKAGGAKTAPWLAAVLGLGIHTKDESVRGDRTTRTTKFHAPPNLLDDDTVRIAAEAGTDTDRKILMDVEFRNLARLPIDLPDFPEHDAAGITYRIQCTVNGQSVEWSHPG